MITVFKGSRVYDLLVFLAYVDEFPYRSLQLLGSKDAWRKLIIKLSQQQEYRLPDCPDRITCRLLLTSGKGKSKTIRLSKSAVSILEHIHPAAAQYYTQTYLRYNRQSAALRIDRCHRVSETAAFMRLAGFATEPFSLPKLQMTAIRQLLPAEPSFYLSNELKYAGEDDVNKTIFSRITGALFYPGGCYAVYNSRDYLMKWNGKGESKARLYLTEIARMNAGVREVTSAILLGKDYEIAIQTLQYLNNMKRAELRFDANYDALHFVPLDSFGTRVARLLTSPDWKETMLALLFEPEDRSYNDGSFEYDAIENGVYILSFLDSDIIRLNRFRDSSRGQQAEVICFPEQVSFLRAFLGTSVPLRTVSITELEDAFRDAGGDESG